MSTENSIENVQLVTATLSVYDGLDIKYLPVAVESILNQTYSNIEFIIVLDGVKRQDIRLYLEDIKNSDNRVRLIDLPENKGLGNALNHAFKAANGEFILRMDADDISYPDRVEKLLGHMMAHKELDVLGSFIEEFCDESESKKVVEHPTEHDSMKKRFCRRNPITHATVMFRNSFFEKAGYYPLISIRNEDTLLFLSGFINGCRFANIPEVLYSVRFSREMGSRRIGFRKSFSDFVDRLRIIIDLKASLISIFYAIGLLIIQNMPYSIYNLLRSKTVYKEK